jgi:tetratricopeptide (TPR) repeat protein
MNIVQKVKPEQTLQHIEDLIKTRQYTSAVDQMALILEEPLPSYQKSHVYRLMADVFVQLSQTDSGEAAYSEALRLDPYNAKAYLGLGVALINKSPERAFIPIQKALELDPRDPKICLALALAHQGVHAYEEAKSYVLKALALEQTPSLPALYTLVKLVYETDEGQEQAKNYIKKYLIQHQEDLDMHYTLAGLYFSQKQYGPCLDILEDILALHPWDQRSQALKKRCQQELPLAL